MPSAHPTGGAEEAFVQLLASDVAKSAQWQVIFLEEGPLVAKILPFVHQSLVVHCGRTREVWKWWRASTKIAQYAKTFKSKLILGWMTKAHVYGGLAAWRAGIDAAWFQHGLPEDGLLDRVSRRLPANAVFTCSEFVAGLQRAKLPYTNVIAVPVGVDLSRFDLHSLPTRTHARQQLGLPTTGPIIGIVGRLQRWKGMHTLIAAMPEVLRSHPDAHCLIVGGVYPAEPEYEPQLRELAESLRLRDKVTFAGAQSDVPVWMQAMDMVIHASEREPFGIVVVEAMALGKAVIASIPGGPAEIIRDGVDGFLTQSGDAELLADRINQLLGDAGLRERLGAEASRRAATQFSSEAFVQRLFDAMN